MRISQAPPTSRLNAELEQLLKLNTGATGGREGGGMCRANSYKAAAHC
jgi:hypothetical protein